MAIAKQPNMTHLLLTNFQKVQNGWAQSHKLSAPVHTIQTFPRLESKCWLATGQKNLLFFRKRKGRHFTRIQLALVLVPTSIIPFSGKRDDTTL